MPTGSAGASWNIRCKLSASLTGLTKRRPGCVCSIRIDEEIAEGRRELAGIFIEIRSERVI